ncbi:ribonuclease Z [Pseudoalteromonas sp. JBTF-M23]|uniref:Ribonuclease Z n=1 Tax=Pseudoalteromonas caenipelagi TaxID=2726988 RepID=A0A849VBY9_9GAMM|nr:ribonuclease Z [Pseudoalteromonas caenipelagi]NOU50358.1 ribonuclease Z [Pseudoalteromonas caenipelagi]
MQIQFLGTSSGSPSRYRNMSAVAVSFDNAKQWLLVDCAEGTQHQILKTNLSPAKLAVICITHIHGDHCYGLPGLLSSMSLCGRSEPVSLIAPQKLIHFIHESLALTDVKLGFDLICHNVEQLNTPLSLPLCQIEPIELKHRVPSFGYKITETHIPKKLKIDKLKANNIESGPHYNALQKGHDVAYKDKTLIAKEYTYDSWRPRTVVICGDNERPAKLTEYLSDVDLLVHEATFTHSDLLRLGMHTGHSDAKRVSEFAQKHAVARLALTHFSVRYHGPGMLEPLKREAHEHYHGELYFAEDLLCLTIPKQGL